MPVIDDDVSDLIFRALFSSIFVGLGLEHLVDDHLILNLMPAWVESPHIMSAGAGIVNLAGGLSILLGYRMRAGALVLGAFLVVVSLAVHLPGIFSAPAGLPADWSWLWTVFQRSNLVKNLCLFGVCVHLIRHSPGRYSLDAWLGRRSE